MAKKTATKKKTAPQKKATKAPQKVIKKPAAQPKKADKTLKSTGKAAKPAVKTSKTSLKVETKTNPKASDLKKKEAVKPALMTKKGKSPASVVEVDEPEVATKSQTIVSLIESDEAAEEPSKAEKVSKVKPVKIERGNLADEKAKWAELFKKYGKDKAVQYKMSEKFSSMAPLQHKILGWGFVLSNENDRLEVLFETGIRMLISNYKS